MIRPGRNGSSTPPGCTGQVAVRRGERDLEDVRVPLRELPGHRLLRLRVGAAGVGGWGRGPGLAVLFGAYDLVSRVSVLAAVPVFVWETSLSAYLLLRGFRPSPLLDRPARVERAVVPA
jgi:hypothetical protein